MPYHFAAESFHTKKLCSRPSSRKAHFLNTENGKKIAFGRLGATYDVHLRLNGKLEVDFLLVIILFLGAFVLSQFTCLMDGQTDGFTIANTALHTMQRGKNG